MIEEFKKFIARGNVIDMAIGLVIGSAFTAVVNSIVDGLIMPIVGALTAGIDFSSIKISLFGVDLLIGSVITAIISFLIIALCMFSVVKIMNKLHKEEEKNEEATTKICPFCKSEIDINATRCPHCTSELN
ncbi:MAG: large conductance mechanosensitive channel protein MscL [Peptoniphilaceae bacterium]|nr:large conductance mechanosensitive channel protein MscL [Peptoniphilaceae bacterium]MDD7383555.1 large conductance mechanosensitive channel protein MscL [Peptoniphilaceae bacterium]